MFQRVAVVIEGVLSNGRINMLPIGKSGAYGVLLDNGRAYAPVKADEIRVLDIERPFC